MTNPKTLSNGEVDYLIGFLARASVTPEVISRLDTFFEFMTPNDLRESLMQMYHSYILNEYDCLPDDFKRTAEGMTLFFNFLKFAGEEFNAQQGRGRPHPLA